MFLALRELRYARLRYLMIGAIITLIAWLVFLLSGLAAGLAADSSAAIQKLPANHLIFQQGSQLLLQRSNLPESDVARVQAVPGVSVATPVGQSTVTVQRIAGGDRLSATILAIDPNGFLAPHATEGKPLAQAAADGVVVDASLANDGVKLGDRLTVQPSGKTLTVTGFTTGHTYSHMPVIFSSVALWQSLRPEANAGGTISAIAIKANDQAVDRIAEAVPGIEIGSKAQVIQNLPGYAEESGTLTLIQVFLVAIAALIIAAFFYVITLQKTAQFGVLKALGASTRYLGRDLLGQVALLTAAGIGLGALLATGVSRLIPASIPFLLQGRLVGLYGLILLAVAIAGALVSLRRIATTDPLIAIGQAG